MPYELRVGGDAVQTFNTEQEAISHARKALQKHPESEPEIFDTTTGKPVAPGASKADRDELAAKVGY